MSYAAGDQYDEFLPDPMPPLAARRATRPDDDRPPFCPTCHSRLVILSTHIDRTATGERNRYQLWGCPRGHATSRRMHGSFSAVEILPNPLLADDRPHEPRPAPAPVDARLDHSHLR